MYLTHYSCWVISLLNTNLDKSAFSTYFFGKLVVRLSDFCVFPACSVFLCHLRKLHKDYIIIALLSATYSDFVLTSQKTIRQNKYISRYESS